jgi:hypothetical protein
LRVIDENLMLVIFENEGDANGEARVHSLNINLARITKPSRTQP